MKVRLKLFFLWGITFDEDHPYAAMENGNREIYYASRDELQRAILMKYPPKQLAAPQYPASLQGGQDPTHTPIHNKPFQKNVLKAESPRNGPK